MIKFVKVGDSIQCQNCGNMFKIDELDSLELGGCNQIAIINKKKRWPNNDYLRWIKGFKE